MDKKWYHIGIDGGGTQCRARLYCPNGKLIGSAKAGPANTRLGLDQVKQSLSEVTAIMLTEAGLDPSVLQNTKVGIGLAGVLSEVDVLRFAGYCTIFPHAVLQSDSYIACLGAHSGNDGAAIITGTGTSVMLIQHGAPHTICSWGFRIADQASGAQMGLLAIRTALKAHDGILSESDFSRSLMATFNHSATDLVDWAETATPSDYALYAPLIIEASSAGDLIAQHITQQCVSDFRDLLDMLINKGAEKISLIGGLSDYYRLSLPEHYHPHLRRPLGDPIDGAIIMAQQLTPDN